MIQLSISAEGLRRHLSSLESLCKELKMEVNTAKTKISVIGRNTNKELFYWKRSYTRKSGGLQVLRSVDNY